MATRKEKCKWCNAKLLVPIVAQTIFCSRCRGVTNFLLNYNNYGYFPSIANGDAYDVPSNSYATTDVASSYSNYRRGKNNKVPQVQTALGPQVLSPPVYGSKRAVLCGVSYKDHPKRLEGSINDVLCMKYFLVLRLGFPDASVIVLTEDEKDPSRIPTKMNIRGALSWLVHGCQAGDSLVFHYSGHGSKVRDLNGDEIDGQDEALCPVDFETEGRILDDELNATIVSPLPRGVTLHAIIDTCFSGTFLDLPYMCRVNRKGYYLWEDHRVPYTTYKGTSGGLAICISACDDHQNSGDTTAFTGIATGALTYGLIETLENEARLTYGQLLIAVRNKIHGVQKAVVAQNGSLASHSSQEPQLSASKKFDIHSKQFTM